MGIYSWSMGSNCSVNNLTVVATYVSATDRIQLTACMPQVTFADAYGAGINSHRIDVIPLSRIDDDTLPEYLASMSSYAVCSRIYYGTGTEYSWSLNQTITKSRYLSIVNGQSNWKLMYLDYLPSTGQWLGGGIGNVTMNTSAIPAVPATPTISVSGTCISGITTNRISLVSPNWTDVDYFSVQKDSGSGYSEVVKIYNGDTEYYDDQTNVDGYYKVIAHNTVWDADSNIVQSPTIGAPVIEAGVVLNDYPTLTFTASTSNMCADIDEVRWYLDGVLTGTSTGNTFSGVLPTSGDTYALTAKYYLGSEGAESNTEYLIFYDTTQYISGFTSNGTFVLPSGYNRLEYVIVGGGGAASGGGAYAFGGNGGAGGYLEGSINSPSGGSYSVVVGSGGTVAGGSATGTNGGYSSFSGLTAYGGGAGGHINNTPDGFSGACGGGAAVWREVYQGPVYTGSGGTGINGQGYSGASSSYDVGDPNKQYPGGGGGAGAPAYGVDPWTGGTGRATTITGDSFTFASGGWGGAINGIIGGSGPGVDGTGDGGGHSPNVFIIPYAGGSGIVIIKYWNDFGIPTPPINETAGDITCTGATLTWTNTYDTLTGNTIQQYTGTTWFDVADVAGNATGYTVTGLTPLNTYQYRIVARNDVTSAVGESIIFQTLDPTPYNLTKLVAINTIGWDINDPPYGTAIRPEIRLSGGTDFTTKALISNDATQYQFSGLSFATDYQCRFVRIGSEYPSEIFGFSAPDFREPFCENPNPYSYTGSTCGNADGELEIIDKSYLDLYSFYLTDISGGTYAFNTNAASATYGFVTGLTAGFYQITATPKPTYWYLYGKTSCNTDWISINNTNTTITITGSTERPVQCGAFDRQLGRISWSFSGSSSTYSLYIYKDNDYNLFYSDTDFTGSTAVFNNTTGGCYRGLIVSNDDDCVALIPYFCVKTLPIMSVAGIKRLFVTSWSQDLDYNYWKSSDDDFFLESEDSSFFLSTKIKEYYSDSGGTLTWYRIPVKGIMKVSQSLAKVRQGIILTDTLDVDVPQTTIERFDQLTTLIGNRWVYVIEDNMGQWWTGGYAVGSQVDTYVQQTGERGGENKYSFNFVAVSSDKLLTALDETWVQSNILT